MPTPSQNQDFMTKLAAELEITTGDVESVLRGSKAFLRHHTAGDLEEILEEAHDAAEDQSIDSLKRYLKEIQRYPQVTLDGLTDLLRAAASALTRGKTIADVTQIIVDNS